MAQGRLAELDLLRQNGPANLDGFDSARQPQALLELDATDRVSASDRHPRWGSKLRPDAFHCDDSQTSL